MAHGFVSEQSPLWKGGRIGHHVKEKLNRWLSIVNEANTLPKWSHTEKNMCNLGFWVTRVF